MGNKNSIKFGNTSSKNNNEQALDFSEGVTIPRRINIKMVQNILLIWLDNNIDVQYNENHRNTVVQLRHVVNTIKIFIDGNQCIEFLENNNNEKVCVIISGTLGQQIVPYIHNMSQVDSIFIFCDNKKYYKEWAKEWSKIKGVFTKISPICDALKEATQQCERNLTSISIMNTSGDAINKKLDQLDPTFMYTQIFKEILLSIKFEQQHIQEFIDYCREQFAEIEDKLEFVNTLEQKYHHETPIWWFTRESILFPMLNRGLRTIDGSILIKMGFFINDLHRQIQYLHQEQFGHHQKDATFTVYRGQGLSNVELNQLKNTKGGLLSFNNFLFTNKDRNVSLRYVNNVLTNPESIGILFVMTIDSSKTSTPFALIDGISFYPAENEILFSMHTVFRVHDIQPMDGNPRLFQVNLILTSDKDKDLHVFTDHIRKETKILTGWDGLSRLLYKLGQMEQAEQIYYRMLDQILDENKKGRIYRMIGLIKATEAEYKKAIVFYEKSLEISKKILPPNDPELASIYGNIGNVYYNMGEYSKALSSHEKALKIQQQTLHSKHPDLAASYNNIGAVYYNMGEYSNSLSYYEKALEIQQQSLPSNHPDLAASYNNIASVYDNMGDYSKALSYYEKSLKTKQQSFPSNHPDLASTYNNIGAVYYNMSEYSKALSYYEKALEIKQQSLPSSHPSLATSYNNIGLVHYKMGEYSKALLSHEKALRIQQETLSSNHPDLASSYNKIGLMYKNMGEYSKARSYYDRAVNIGQHSLPPNHPHLQLYRKNVDLIKKKL